MGDGGKGSRSRPYSVSKSVFNSNWDAIFKTPKERDDAIAMDEAFKEIEKRNANSSTANNDHHDTKQN